MTDYHLTQPTHIEILEFERISNQNRDGFYLLLDNSIFLEFTSRGLIEEQIVLMQKLLLLAFRLQSPILWINPCTFSANQKNILKNLRILASNSFIKISECE